jgi:hypothetical protein
VLRTLEVRSTSNKMRRPKISYPRGKPTGYYGNFSFGPACAKKRIRRKQRGIRPEEIKNQKQYTNFNLGREEIFLWIVTNSKRCYPELDSGSPHWILSTLSGFGTLTAFTDLQQKKCLTFSSNIGILPINKDD